MAQFAQLDENNIVIEIIAINNEVIENKPFPESETIGVEFCQSLYGANTLWAQTSYNSNFRYRYAGIGYTFDATALPNGAFIQPKPYSSWVLDTQTYQWEAPIPYPDDGQKYSWDEATQSWVLITSPF